MGFERDGRELLIVVVKATYLLAGDEPHLAAEQLPLVEADRFSGEPGLSAPLFETDFAHRKPACDVLLVGSAYAPNGEPASRVRVGLQVGTVNKEFWVVGQRTWDKSALSIAATSPQPFISMPISYDVAFGGTDRTEQAEGKVDTFLANPVGKGYWRHNAQIDGQLLPNTEELNRAVNDPGGDFAPMALSPIGRNWAPRAAFAGTYDERWIENDAPFWPADFDYRYFQAAPPDQIISYPVGGERVVLKNLSADGHRAFELPTRRMPITFVPHHGRDVTLEAHVDTVVLEPDMERFTLTWRASLAMGRSIFDVKEIVVGEPSLAEQRARRLPGKRHFRTLGELARARERGEYV